jgi:tetratricopeptide (TPR) repeat protein
VKAVRRGEKALFFAFVLVASAAVTLASCAKAADSASFSKKLRTTDSLIGSGKKARALRELSSLRKRAESASQWLSIARRERKLGSYQAAAKTLAEAGKALPASDSVAACLADTLAELGRLDEAEKYAGRLAKTGFPELAASIELARCLAAGPQYPEPQWLEAAYRATGNPVFRNDAAVLYAASGKFPEASALFPEPTPVVTAPVAPSDTPTAQSGSDLGLPAGSEGGNASVAPLSPDIMLQALIAYDGGFWDRVVGLFPAPNDSRLDREMLSILADAAWKGGNEALAREVWCELVSREPEFSPIPYYNLAKTAEDPEVARTSLVRCTELFPAWYPAVAQIVRLGGHADRKSTDADDPVTKTLKDAGFMSLNMEASLHDGRFTPDDARETLRRALAADKSGADVRLKIEELRYALGEDGDGVRASSDMWKLLEAYGKNPALYRYATWFFAVSGDADAAFSVNRANPDGADPFYLGLEAACAGNAAEANTEFSKVASNEASAWAALGNIARLAAKAADYGKAEETVALAAKLAPNDRIRSKLFAEEGEYLLALNESDRARKTLGYALDLDPDNYHARSRLRALEAEDTGAAATTETAP